MSASAWASRASPRPMPDGHGVGRRRALSVRTQITGLGVAVVLLVALVLAGDASLLRSARDRFDKEDGVNAVRRARTALARGLEADRRRLTESAWWDDAYRYMAHPGGPDAATFLRRNFIDWLPAQYGDRLIALWRPDRSSQFRWEAPEMRGLADRLPRAALGHLLDQKRSTAGLLIIGKGVYAMAGALVLPSSGGSGNAVPRGYLVVLRPVGDAMASQLAQELQEQLSLRPADVLRDQAYRRIVALGDSVATGFRVEDVFGRQAIMVELRAPRNFLAAMERWFHHMLILGVAVGVVLLVLLFVVITRLLLRPFARLDQQFARMREEGHIARLSGLPRAREWVMVVEGFNHLVEATEQSARALAEARDRAVAATTAKSEFLANVSHEIRTPMNAILGLSDLLRRTTLTADQRRYVEAVHGSGEALLALVNDVLDLSKVEAGRIIVETIPFDLRRAAQDTVAMFAPRAAERGVVLEITIASEVPERVHGDPGRLRQVLINLIGNALKFTSEGAVRVRLALQGAGEEPAVLFEVADTGIGIPTDKLEKIFDKYAQADASTTRQFGGTGLGLAISRDLVRLMGGEITVRSGPGQGSIFAFALPFPRCTGVPARIPRDLPLTGCRLLQIGLDGFARKERTTTLFEAGLRVIDIASFVPPAERLRDAVAAGDPFEVVLIEAERLSLQLELTIAACRSEAVSPVAIVVCLDHGERGAAGRIRSAGAHACLVAPTVTQDLLETITVAREVVRQRLAWPLITRHWLTEARLAEDAPPPGEPAVAHGHASRVLVTDDNDLNRLVASEYLRHLGAEVEMATGGEEAVARTAAGGLDLVFMDCQMPGLDGYEATRRIREREGEGQRLPIVAMTANAMPGERERCLAAGMDDYVSKPVREADLARLLRRWVPGAASGGARAAPIRTPGVQAASPTAGALTGIIAPGPGVSDVADRLIARFLRDAPAQVAEVGEALMANDLTRAARAAYSLRGAARAIGAHDVQGLCQAIEEAVEGGALSEAWAGYARLEGESARTLDGLRHLQKENAATPPLDEARIEEFRHLETLAPGLMAEVVGLFLRDAPRRLEAIEHAVRQGDAGLTSEVAHALKGSALQLGAMPLGWAAAELEREARAGDLSQGAVRVARLLAEFERTREGLTLLLVEAQPSVPA